jgi:hypothetical protein
MRPLDSTNTPACPSPRVPVRPVVAGVALALAFAAATAVAGDVTVTASPWGGPTVNTFDPNKPPGTPADPTKPGDLPGPPVDSDGKPIIPSDEAAVATPAYTSSFKFTFSNNANGTVTVKTIDATIGGGTTIYDPNDADKQLKDHELGHDKLNKFEYDKDAKTKFEQALQNAVGKVYPNKAVAQAAIAKLIADNAAASLFKQWSDIGEDYDKYTDHGKNDVKDPGTGKPIDTDTGVSKAEADQTKAAAAGSNPSSPDLTQPHASTAPDPATVSFDPTTSRLSFGGDLLVNFTNDPTDPIIGRGQFQIDPMVLIGPTGNGAVHLSDTEVRIVDVPTGATLLDGYLDQVAYMPSTLPGFAGMIEGDLDILPDYVGGINDTIGSPFLQGLDAARTAGTPTAVWFYADQALFDAQGDSLTAGSDVGGSLKMGVPNPEPSTLAPAGLAALTGLAYAWRRRKAKAAD